MNRFSLINIGRAVSTASESTEASPPDWVQANPQRIARALAQATSRPSGGWFVLDASRTISAEPRRFDVDGLELVAWRSNGSLFVAPNACPHMGAELACGRAEADHIVCPWHGLRLGPKGFGRWQMLPSYDDGVLSWVRLDGAREQPTAVPILAERPAHFIGAVIRMEAACDPADVIANRLDPWHGAHYHPHSFSRLRVLDVSDDAITLRVAFRVLGPVCVEVDAQFHSPEPRTIVMTILEGDGEGSVVETHATPIAPGRTAIVEATLATSERWGFRAARRLSSLLRPLIERRAKRLWVEDIAYAERLYTLRNHTKPTSIETSKRASSVHSVEADRDEVRP